MPDRRRKWTVAVYLAGGENVSREMVVSLHDIRDAALDNRDALRVLAQFDPGSKSPRLFTFDDTTRAAVEPPGARSFRNRAPIPLGLANYECAMPESTSAHERLASFVDRARAASLADPLMLVISGHGNGAVGEFLGYRSGSESLFLSDLRNALAAGERGGGKIDIVGLDCCNMSMVEVGFELAGHARFMVASEGYILNHGWPYRPVLDALADLEPEEAAAEAARQYAGNYSDYGLVDVPSHCAVCRLASLDLLADRVGELAELLTATIADPDVWRPAVLAHWEAQSFKDEEYVDLADFCERLSLHVGHPDIRRAAKAVAEAVGEAVVLSSACGSAFQYSTGLSVYFPWCHDAAKRAVKGGPSDLDRYRELGFSKRTGWADFLDAYLVATRREPRSDFSTVEPLDVASVSDPSSPGAEPEDLLQEAHITIERKESDMAIKRFPPWSTKGGLAKPASVKNHPMSETSEEALPIRRFPPWSTKGGAIGERASIKNHPRNKD